MPTPPPTPLPSATPESPCFPVLGEIALAPGGLNGQSANGPSSSPALSADGRYVVFDSAADNLVSGDTNEVEDVFVVTLNEEMFPAVGGAPSTPTPGAGR